ncbi:hypothetical protein SVIO_035390 [Streptomyces violaceusniger]|uniref:Uncharacterized protein n=1 Tax=Streptomyces violaceusniger TaxID=68280 RepID=A0A4D4L185_STRVO|nr:hypothetical protein SVIO_035390 [Streptomyces violaceusniger]
MLGRSDRGHPGKPERGQHRKVVRGRAEVRVGDARQPGRDPTADDLDALGGEDGVDALMRVLGEKVASLPQGSVAQPSRSFPAIRRKARPSGRSLMSPAAMAYGTSSAAKWSSSIPAWS